MSSTNTDQNKGCIDYKNAIDKISVKDFKGRPLISFGFGFTKMHAPPMMTAFQPYLGESGDHGQTKFSMTVDTAGYTFVTKLYEFPDALDEKTIKDMRADQERFHKTMDAVYDKYIDWLMAPENKKYYFSQSFFKKLYNTAKKDFQNMYSVKKEDIDETSENFLKVWRACLTDQDDGVKNPVKTVTWASKEDGEERSAVQLRFKQRLMSTFNGNEQKNEVPVLDEQDEVIDGAELALGDMVQPTLKIRPWVMASGAGFVLTPIRVRRVLKREYSSGEGMPPLSCYNLPNLKRENEEAEAPPAKKIKTETPPALRV